MLCRAARKEGSFSDYSLSSLLIPYFKCKIWRDFSDRATPCGGTAPGSGKSSWRWWQQVAMVAQGWQQPFHPPPHAHARWVNHINPLVQPAPLGSSQVCESWPRGSLSSSTETTAENQEVTGTLCSLRPGQTLSVVQVLPPCFKLSFWSSSPVAIRCLQSLHLHSPTLYLSLGVSMLVASPGPQVP